jgi:hypothetical protein
MEAVTHDPSVRERRPDRVTIGLRRVDRDDLDPGLEISRKP